MEGPGRTLKWQPMAVEMLYGWMCVLRYWKLAGVFCYRHIGVAAENKSRCVVWVLNKVVGLLLIYSIYTLSCFKLIT